MIHGILLHVLNKEGIVPQASLAEWVDHRLGACMRCKRSRPLCDRLKAKRPADAGRLQRLYGSAALRHAFLAGARGLLLALGGLLPGWSHAGFTGHDILLWLGAVTCSGCFGIGSLKTFPLIVLG